MLFTTCHLCLSGSNNLIPLYDRNQDNLYRIKYALPELVLFGPEVPQFICCECMVSLTSFYIFKGKCLENNIHLINMLNKKLKEQHQQHMNKTQTLQYPQQQTHFETTRPGEYFRNLSSNQDTTLLFDNTEYLQKNPVRNVVNIDKNVNVKLTKKQNYIERRTEQDSFSLSAVQKQKNSIKDVVNVDKNIATFIYSTDRNNVMMTEKQNHIERRNEPNSFSLSAEYKQNNLLEDRNQIAEKLIPFHDRVNDKQVTNQQKDIETRRIQRSFEYELSEADKQKYFFKDVVNVDKNIATFNYSTDRNSVIMTEKQNPIERRNESVNEFIRTDLQIGDSFSLSAEYTQHYSIEDNNYVPFYNSNKSKNYEQVTNQEKPFETKRPQTNFNNELSQAHKENIPSAYNRAFGDRPLTKSAETRGSEKHLDYELKCTNPQTVGSVLLSEEYTLNNTGVKETMISFCNNTNDQKSIETRNKAAFENKSMCTNLDTEEEYIQINFLKDNVEVKDDLKPFCKEQLTNKQRNIETRRLEAIYENELKCSKPKIEHSVVLSDKNKWLASNTNLKENQKNIETRSTGRVFENTIERTKENQEKQIQNTIIDVKESFDPFYSQQSTNEQNNKKKRLENELESFKQGINDSGLLSEENHTQKNCINKDRDIPFYSEQTTNEENSIETTSEVVIKKELTEIENEDAIDVKDNFDAFRGEQLTNQQKDIFKNELKYSNPSAQSFSLSTEEHSQKCSVESDFDVKENFSSFISQQLTNENKYSDIRTPDADVQNCLQYFKQEKEFSISLPEADHSEQSTIEKDLNIKENFSSFTTQELSNERKDSVNRTPDAVVQNSLPYFKQEKEFSISLPEADHSEESSIEKDLNIKENFSSFTTQELSNERKDSVNSTPDAVVQNSLPYFNQEKEFSISLPQADHSEESTIEKDLNIKENFSSFTTQELSNERKYSENRAPDAVVQNSLPYFKQEKEFLVSLPEAEHSQKSTIEDDLSIKENFSSFTTPQLSNERKDSENRTPNAVVQNSLPYFKQENGFSVSLPEAEHSQKSTIDDNLNIKENFSSFITQELSTEWKDSETKMPDAVIQNCSPYFKQEKEDLVSEVEDTQPNSFAEDIVKEDFTPFYKNIDSKFYQVLVNNINSESVSYYSELSAASFEANTQINSFGSVFTKVNNAESDSKVTCLKCKKVMKVSHMKTHKRLHDDNKDNECPICHKKIIRQRDLTNHIKNHYKNFRCTVCNKKYKYESHFKEHQKIHTSGPKFECEICKKKFYYKDGVKSHMVTHNKRKEYECTICHNRYMYISHLTQHEKAHERPKITYDCTECNKSFPRPHNLRQHQKIHRGIKEFKCSICNMEFLHNTHLKQHTRVHIGIKKYSCSICKKSFLQNGSLRKHMESHDYLI